MPRHRTGPLDKLIWRSKSAIRRHTWIYLQLARFRSFPGGAPKTIDPAAELTIEAFPRSANWFAYEAFVAAQGRPVPMIHHFHAPGAVACSLNKGLPTLVIIREPALAVTSWLIMIGRDLLAQGFRDYLNFYEPLEARRDEFVVARSESVVSDFGAVIRAVNARFGTSYVEFDHTPENVREVKRKIARDVEQLSGSADLKAQLVSLPNAQRDACRDALLARIDEAGVQSLRRRAEALHRRWFDDADV
jgi:hypothetical protein